MANWHRGQRGEGPGSWPVGAAPFLRLCTFWALLLLLAGCAVIQPRVEVVPGPERARVAAALEELHRQECNCCLDASVTVTLKVLMGSGTVSGYLQAMSPSFLKFVGVNPLGQPLLMLVSDGDRFQYLAVAEGKGYAGDVRAETFVKYAPAGFEPKEAFFWLNGRLPPGPITVEKVDRGETEDNYWLTVRIANGRRRLLFDGAAGLILAHQMLDGQGGVLMDARYDRRQRVGGGCLLPGRITVTAPNHRATLMVTLSDWLEQVSLTENDFSFELPPGFQRVEVK